MSKNRGHADEIKGKDVIQDIVMEMKQFELFWKNCRTKLGKLSTIIGVYHDQEIKNLQ